MSEGRGTEEISLAQVVLALRSHWKLICAVTVIGGSALYTFLIKQFPATTQVSTVVELSFKGIEKRKNPDGSFFRKEQIVTPVVLNRAYKKVAERFPEDDLKFLLDTKGEIEVTAVIPKTVVARQREDLTYKYVPNKFALRIATGRTDSRSSEIYESYLENVVEEYKRYSIEQYGSVNLVVTHFPENFLKEYDYEQIMSILEANIKALGKTLDKLLGEEMDDEESSGRNRRDNGLADRNFESETMRPFKSNISLANIRNQLTILEKVKLAKHNALISNLHLSKNPEDQIKIYEEMILVNEFELRKYRKIASSVSSMIDRFTGFKLTPSKGGGPSNPMYSSVMLNSSILEKLKNDSYLSVLIKRYLEAEEKAGDLSTQTEKLRKKHMMLSQQLKESKGTVPESIKKRAAAMAPILASIHQEIVSIGSLINEYNSDFIKSGYMFNKSIEISQMPFSTQTRRYPTLHLFIVSLVISGMAGALIAVLVEFSRKGNGLLTGPQKQVLAE